MGLKGADVVSTGKGKDYFKKGELAAKKGNYEYAIELFTQGLIHEPSSADQRKRLHKVCVMAIHSAGGNPQGGLKAKFRLAPLLATCKKLTMQKKWPEAVLEFEKAVRIAPQNAQILFGLAEALYEQAQEDESLSDASISTLEEVLEFDKANIEAYKKLGRLWAEKEDPEKAITYWEKVRQYRPEDKEAGKAIRDLSAATMVKKTEERKAAAGDDSFTAVLADGEEASELEKKQRTIRNDDDRREAIGWKKDELREDPKNSKLWRELGNLYQDLREWKYAEAAYKKASEVNPHDMFVKEKLGTLREARMRHELDALQTKLESAKNNGGAGVDELRSQVEKMQGKYRLFLVDEYDRRVKEHPTDMELKLQFGSHLKAAGKYDDAIGQFQQAIKDPKLKTGSLNQIGQCFEQKKLYDLAKTQFKMGLETVAASDSEIAKELKYNLAIVTEKKGDIEEALGHYQDLMAIDIGYRDISERVSNLMS